MRLQKDKLLMSQLKSKPFTEEIWVEIDSIGKKIDANERLIMEHANQYHSRSSILENDFDSIVNHLGKNDVVIEFADNSGQPQGGYFAFIIRKNWETPLCVELGSSDEIHPLGFNDYQINQTNNQYYQFVWSAIDNYINNGDNVYFSPTGLFHQMNIEIFKDSTGIMACDKYNLNRVSSSRQLCKTTKNVDYSSSALFGGIRYDIDTTDMIANSMLFHNAKYIATRGFVADSTNRTGWNYLPGTKDEINQINNLMQNHNVSTTVYSDIHGSEEAFKSLSGMHIPIIHIATHGFFFKNEEAKEKAYFQNAFGEEGRIDEDNSLKRSGLIFAGGQNTWLGKNLPSNVEDGVLLAEEIAVMDLSGTDLVVMSACETGLGDITSDGVFGLQRAFKMAGVQTLVMSLWKVDDNATSLMMQTFYEHLLSGMSKREAFSLAQAAVRAKYPEPYYWAGFIMLD